MNKLPRASKIVTKSFSEDESADTSKIAESPAPEVLSAAHLLQLETMSRDIEITRLQLVIKELESKNKILEQKVASHEVESAKILCLQAGVTYENKKKLRNNLISEIKPIYGLTDSFGYNPDSGVLTR